MLCLVFCIGMKVMSIKKKLFVLKRFFIEYKKEIEKIYLLNKKKMNGLYWKDER